MGWPVWSLAAPPTPQALVSDAVRQYLTAQADAQGWREPVFEVTVPTRLDHDGQCLRPLEVRPVDTRQLSRMRFEVTCPGNPGWNATFVARARVSARVLVAASAIASRQALQAADLREEVRDITSTPDAVSAPEEAEGQTSRRALRAGQVLQKRFLLADMLVKRGSAVQIVARAGGVQVTHAGESLDSGARGQVVRVRNLASGKVIDARVVSHGVVEPISSAPMPQSRD